MNHHRRTLLAATALAALPGAAFAQQGFPNRPVKIVYVYSPGGPGDSVSRVLANGMSTDLGQPVLVENKVGANGGIGTLFVAHAPPDGYTLLVAPVTTVVNASASMKDPAFDALTTLVPIASLALTPLVILAHPSVPFNDLPGFIDWARGQADGVNVATAGPTLEGTLALLSRDAKIRFVNVPYRGTAEGIQAVLAGEVKVFFNTPSGPTSQYVKEGKLKAIAVTTAEPSQLFPGVTPMRRMLPGFIQDINFAVWAPPRTPPDIVGRLGAAFRKQLADPATAEKFIASGVEVNPGGPDAVLRIVQREIDNVKRVADLKK